MITLTATLSLADLKDLADALDARTKKLQVAVGETRKAAADAQRAAYADALPGRATARAESAHLEYEEANDNLARWNALRAELGLR